MKTAELFALSCELGARLSGGTPSQQEGLRAYGLNLGIAYQVYDDCLDLFGTESVAGKSLGTDLAGGKVTLPLLVVLERARSTERARALELVRHWDSRHQAELQELLARHEVLAEAQSTVQGFLDKARGALECVPHGLSRCALDDLTRFLSQQTSQLGI
jgi:octaprenyl-diphosphate synthase